MIGVYQLLRSLIEFEDVPRVLSLQQQKCIPRVFPTMGVFHDLLPKWQVALDWQVQRLAMEQSPSYPRILPTFLSLIEERLQHTKFRFRGARLGSSMDTGW